MEPFDLAVGLWPVGAGSLVSDTELSACRSPSVGLIGRAVVGEYALNGDAVIGEPRHCASQDADRGLGLLIVVNLRIGDSRVIVDDGVDVRVAEQRVTLFSSASVLIGRSSVLAALLAANVPPASTERDVAELLHVDMDQRTGVIVFVTASWFTGLHIDMRETIQSAADQHRVDR